MARILTPERAREINALRTVHGGGRKSRAWESHLGQACPSTEVDVRERFRIINEFFGFFDILISQEDFPDYVLLSADRHRLRVEVELRSANFRCHGHDEKACDMILCWIHNWPDAPISVWPIEQLWYVYEQLRDLGIHSMRTHKANNST